MATIVDISRKTGLSIATISKYLNGGKLRERNRIAVEDAIKELGYEANEMARGLKMNRTMTVGVLLPEICDMFGTQVISSMQRILQENGYSCMICMFGDSQESLMRQLAFVRRKKADGIIVLPNDDGDACLNDAIEAGTPVVLFDRLVKGVSCDAVVIDNRAAAREAANALIKAGHSRIGFLCGYENNYTARERLAGYVEAMTAAGLTIDEALVKRGELTIDKCRKSTLELLQGPAKPTAIIASNYYSAQGMVLGVNDCGLEIPKALSVVVFDDMQSLRLVRPALTTIAQPLDEIGVNAAGLLMDRLKGYSGPPRIKTLAASLRERASVGAVRD